MRKRIIALACLGLPAFAQELPVRSVTLSNAGLAQIERHGPLPADGRIRLTIPLPQVDDVLKSLVALDATGQVLGLSLPAREMAQEAFQGLPLREADFADRLSLLRALRGQPVELAGAQGRLLDATGEGDALRILLLTERGVLSLALREGDALRLMDGTLAARVDRAAAALAAARAADAREAVLRFSPGAREVGLSYVTGAPLWKPSWRLVIGDGTARLSGWAVVENRSGADWRDVRLSLVSGNPAAFRQALYTPVLRERIEVPVRGAEAFRPQADTGARPPAPMALAAPAPVPAPSLRAAPPGQAAQPQARAESTEGRVAYTLPQPVTVLANETANLPFLDATLPAETLWWVQGAQARNPLNAVRIRNSTEAVLPDGIVTLYAARDLAFLGDAELRAFPPGEARLLAYARDRDVLLTPAQERRETLRRIGLARGVLLLEGEEEQRIAYAVDPHGARGAIIFDLPAMPRYAPRFTVTAQGDFGLRHEARIEGQPMRFDFTFARPTQQQMPLWDPGLGDPAGFTWRRTIPEQEARRLPGGPGSLERLQQELDRTAPDTPGRDLLADVVARMTALRRLLDAARAATAAHTADNAALERARAAADDRSGAEREAARRALNTASQAAERSGNAADAAWRAWQEAVLALLARSG